MAEREEGCEAQPVFKDDATKEHAREERRAAERTALARVFEDVRRQSRNSRLVAPKRWEELGIVPEHLSADDFEMLVYEYWEEHRDDECAKKAAGVESTGDAASQAVHAHTAHPHARGSVIASVGVPAFLRKKQAVLASENEPDAGEGTPEDGKGQGPCRALDASAGAPDDEPADATAGDSAMTPDDDGEGGGLPAEFAGLRLPEGYELVELEGEWALVPVKDSEAAERSVDCSGIVALVGAHSYYFYDRTGMTDAYAHWAFLAAEDDDVVTFVDCVREESRVYPRPMPVDSLENEPYGFSRERIERAWEAAQDSGDYDDIERTEASNGDVYFFSTRYLSRTRAEALAEWDAVERWRNV